MQAFSRMCAGVLALALAGATPLSAQNQTAAGRIKVASGSALIVRQGTSIPAQAGQVVFESDELRTGGDGRIGVTLKDDTRFVHRSEQRGTSRTLCLCARRRELRPGPQVRARRGGLRLTVGLRSSRPMPFVLRRHRRSWVCAARAWRFASSPNVARARLHLLVPAVLGAVGAVACGPKQTSGPRVPRNSRRQEPRWWSCFPTRTPVSSGGAMSPTHPGRSTSRPSTTRHPPHRIAGRMQ